VERWDRGWRKGDGIGEGEWGMGDGGWGFGNGIGGLGMGLGVGNGIGVRRWGLDGTWSLDSFLGSFRYVKGRWLYYRVKAIKG